jgi:hypothetical protein
MEEMDDDEDEILGGLVDDDDDDENEDDEENGKDEALENVDMDEDEKSFEEDDDLDEQDRLQSELSGGKTDTLAAMASTTSVNGQNGSEMLVCKVCNKLFDNLHRLQRHMMCHDMSPELRKFKCEYCNKAFKFKHHLKVCFFFNVIIF